MENDPNNVRFQTHADGPTHGWATWNEGEGYGWKAWGPQGSEGGHHAAQDVAQSVAIMAMERLRKPNLRVVE